MKNEFLKAVTVKTETIKLETLNNMEITIKEPNINQSDKIEEVRQKVINGESTNEELIFLTCKTVMIEPSFNEFTDEDLENLTRTGMNALTEIYMRVPEIGMTESERLDYIKRLQENFENQIQKILSDEELEKKSSKKKDLDLNLQES